MNDVKSGMFVNGVWKQVEQKELPKRIKKPYKFGKGVHMYRKYK